ncbi:hypothetical protein BOTBODRAFT_48965 [Botryobasidium botryosum FD-172 SS1]|uniref:Uncharacterized protein n=1 Tax=Botryobasidium botryosum (strain FD-172 SS1) TaxID=930990 RepID=A0A067LVE6_BOTB1|nr:hypothetical protein BOTBODRAFT_48965 [Botryobasidium botryosum FD-172 SS1]
MTLRHHPRRLRAPSQPDLSCYYGATSAKGTPYDCGNAHQRESLARRWGRAGMRRGVIFVVNLSVLASNTPALCGLWWWFVGQNKKDVLSSCPTRLNYVPLLVKLWNMMDYCGRGGRADLCARLSARWPPHVYQRLQLAFTLYERPPASKHPRKRSRILLKCSCNMHNTISIPPSGRHVAWRACRLQKFGVPTVLDSNRRHEFVTVRRSRRLWIEAMKANANLEYKTAHTQAHAKISTHIPATTTQHVRPQPVRNSVASSSHNANILVVPPVPTKTRASSTSSTSYRDPKPKHFRTGSDHEILSCPLFAETAQPSDAEPSASVPLVSAPSSRLPPLIPATDDEVDSPPTLPILAPAQPVPTTPPPLLIPAPTPTPIPTPTCAFFTSPLATSSVLPCTTAPPQRLSTSVFFAPSTSPFVRGRRLSANDHPIPAFYYRRSHTHTCSTLR